MISLDLGNMKLDHDKIQYKVDAIKKMEKPAFALHKPDFKEIDKFAKLKYDNLIVIGNGGSITSFWAYFVALNNSDVNVYVLTTMDPDQIAEIKENCPKDKTLVVPISKSGTTVGAIEDLFALFDYPILAITSDNNAALMQLAKKKKWDYLIHPEIGGRFSGTTVTGYLPAALCGMNIMKIDKGARKMYKKCSPSKDVKQNPALQLALALYLLEFNGYSEIFLPVYSRRLEGFDNLIVQLMHETACKGGRGQTIYAATAPEAQHHTSQRFLGGKKNVIGLFVRQEKYASKDRTKVPAALKKIPIRDGVLGDLNNIPLSKCVEFEYQGTWQDALRNNIPSCTLSVEKINEESIGEYIAFWHYVAVYSAVLRGVDPFDQPQVEASKAISFALRKKYK